MEVLVLDGKSYVKASKAALDHGYTPDYVGQLCRSGNIDARLVGRTWYVDAGALANHRVEKKRNARVKAREQAKKTIEEYRRLKVEKSERRDQNLHIRYEPDTSELIPKVRKLEIEVEHRVQQVKTTTSGKSEEKDSKGYIVENEGKKILMSGTLKVIDVSEELENSDVTVLHPKIIRHKKEKKQSQIAEGEKQRTLPVITENSGSEEVEIQTANQNTYKKKEFFDRLKDEEVDITTLHTVDHGERYTHKVEISASEDTYPSGESAISATEHATEFHGNESEETIPHNEISAQEPSKQGFVLVVVIMLFLCVVVAGSVALNGVWKYSSESDNKEQMIDTSYRIEILGTFDSIKKLLKL